MKSIFKFLLISVIVIFVFTACNTVAISDRKQLNFVSEGELNTMSEQNYRDFLKTSKISSDKKMEKSVKDVGMNIKNAVEKYFKDKNQSDKLANYKWEFNLVEDEQVNAWCMPGGRVVVYTGIMKLVESDTELAVIMGHEIAHAIANHGAERMSQQTVAAYGAKGLEYYAKNKSESQKDMYMKAYGATANVGVILPYSRLHEKEADELGLVFMAMAGYDPNAAVGFWEKMAKLGSGKKMELLSTHPSDEKRIKEIKEKLPKAMEYYKPPKK